MAIKEEKREWGIIRKEIYDPPKEVTESINAFGVDRKVRKIIYEAGELTVMPKATINLHVHWNDCEDYIPEDEGTEILVATSTEAECYEESKLEAMFRLVVPKTMISCPKECAHALRNTMDKPIRVKFQKYHEYKAP